MIRYRTCRPVKEGEELCIYYGPHARFDEVEKSESDEDGLVALSRLELDVLDCDHLSSDKDRQRPDDLESDGGSCRGS